MANIDTYLQQIMAAIYGEDVRGAIHDAIQEINEVVQNWESGLMDTSLTSTTLPAQGKAVGDAVGTATSNSNSVFQHTVVNQMFDSSDVTTDFYYKSDGTRGQSAAWNAWLVEISPSKTYYFNNQYAGGTTPCNVYFDTNRNRISSFDLAEGINFITPPSNAKYIGFSIHDDCLNKFEFSEYVNVFDTVNLTESLSIAVNDIDSDLDNSIVSSLYNASDNRENLYYRDGGILTASEAWNASKLYELKDGYIYYYDGLNNLGTAPVHCYFNTERTYISSFTPATGKQFLSVPNGAKYVAFSIKDDDVSTFRFNELVDAKTMLDNNKKLEHTVNNITGVYSDGTQGVELGSLTGSVASGVTEVDSETRVRTGYLINPLEGTDITITSGYSARVFVFDKYFNALSVGSWVTRVYVTNPSRLIRIVMKKDDDSTLTVDDFDTAFGNYFDDYTNVKDVQTDISNVQSDINEIKSDFDTLANKHPLIASIENSAWSWWMYPQVAVNENYRKIVAFGEVDSSGIAGIGQVNLETEQELKINVWNAGADDHNGMAILKVDLGHFLIAGAKHSEENILHLWRSMNRNSIDVLNPEVTIEFPDTVTYAQLFRTPDNKVVLFTRVGVISWYACYSKDTYGEEWNAPFKLISSNIQYYCMFRPSTDPNIINVAMYSNPNWTTTDTRIRFAHYNITNKILYDLNGNALTTAGGFVSYENVDIVVDIPNYSPTGSLRNRLLDVAITSPTEYAILYCRFTNETDGVYYASVNGSTYQIANAGGCFYTPSCYYGGAIFVPKNTSIVYLSRYYNNRYHLEKYLLTNGEYIFDNEIDSSNIDGLIYPTCRPIIDVDGKVLVYQKGCTSLTSFQRFSYDAKIKKLT